MSKVTLPAFRPSPGNTHMQTYFIIPRLTLCSNCKTSALIYVLLTDVDHPDLWGSMIRPGFCLGRESMVYIYTRRVLGVVKANTVNSIVLRMAHMSGGLLLCPLTPRHGCGDHISMCDCFVVHWSSVNRLQDNSFCLCLTWALRKITYPILYKWLMTCVK